MNVANLDPETIVATVGEALIVVLIGFMGTQVYLSSKTAKGHLANAALPRATAATARVAGANPSSGVDDVAPIVEQLNQYYAANISQGYAIFWASLLSMIVGFVVILAGIDAAGTNSTTAIVAGVAGVLSQFIAATFLVALRSTQQQSTVYAQTLADLRVRDLHAAAEARTIALGLQLLNEIAGDGAQDLANQTRAGLAMGLIVKDGTPAPVAPAPGAVAPTPAAPPPVGVTVAPVPRAASVRGETVAFDSVVPAQPPR
jgi:hypothetical protein